MSTRLPITEALAAKKWELRQQLARRNRCPQLIFGNCEANDVASSGNIV
jgi:hypothetical protein